MTDDELLAARADLFGKVFVLVQHLTRQTDAALAPLDLTTHQWLLLAVLTQGFAGRSPTLTEAAARYGSSRQNVKQIALGLEARGFLRLVPDPGDGRATLLEVADRIAVFDEPATRARGESLLADATAGLSHDETLLLRDLVRRWLAGLSGDAGAAGGSSTITVGASARARRQGTRPRGRTARGAEGRRGTVFQVVAAAIVAIHGLIHLIGFVVPWGIAQVQGFPYRTTALDGAVALGDAGARAVGVVWLVCAVGFVVAGVGIWRGYAWALPLTAILAVVSVALCVLGLPEAVAGIVVNVAILGVVALAAFVQPSLIGSTR